MLVALKFLQACNDACVEWKLKTITSVEKQGKNKLVRSCLVRQSGKQISLLNETMLRYTGLQSRKPCWHTTKCKCRDASVCVEPDTEAMLNMGFLLDEPCKIGVSVHGRCCLRVCHRAPCLLKKYLKMFCLPVVVHTPCPSS